MRRNTRRDANYSNWELSADRANSARRLLQQDGVRTDQVTQVRGFADQLLRVKNNPYDPSNRRISILVKNQDSAAPPPQSGARAGEWTVATATRSTRRSGTVHGAEAPSQARLTPANRPGSPLQDAERMPSMPAAEAKTAAQRAKRNHWAS